jgi:hypothetical protein
MWQAQRVLGLVERRGAQLKKGFDVDLLPCIPVKALNEAAEKRAADTKLKRFVSLRLPRFFHHLNMRQHAVGEGTRLPDPRASRGKSGYSD